MSPRPILELTIPGLRLVPEVNQREHWTARLRRARIQRDAVTAQWLSKDPFRLQVSLRDLPLRVTITRIAPRRLDSDNAVGAAKHVRDQIADIIGINDNDPRIDWVVCQAAGVNGRDYAVNIRIEAA